MKKKPLYIIIGVFAIIIGFGVYYYYQVTKPHYIINATEKTLKDIGMVPSSMKITEATFFTRDGEGIVLIKYIYKNTFGADTDGNIILEFAATPLDMKDKSASGKLKQELFQKDMASVKNGSLKMEPFSVMSFKSATINDQPLSEAQQLILSTALLTQKLDYNGPALGGNVIELNADGKHKFDFPVLEYKPNEVFPYKRKK